MPVVVTLPAEIDFMNAAEVCDQICAVFRPGIAVVVADLTATTFCDTAGIRHLLLADERARAGQVELRFVVPAVGSVQRVLGLTGVDRVLAVYRTLDTAIAGRHPSDPEGTQEITTGDPPA
jgi:anti-sigma B factor antagonist